MFKCIICYVVHSRKMLFLLVSSITVCRSLLIYESMNIYVLRSFTYFHFFSSKNGAMNILYIYLDGIFISLGCRLKSSILDHKVCALSGQISSSNLSECLFSSVFSAAAAVYERCTAPPPCKQEDASIWKCFICWKCNPQCDSVRRGAVFEGLGPYSVSLHTLCWERIEQKDHKYSDLNPLTPNLERINFCCLQSARHRYLVVATQGSPLSHFHRSCRHA